MIKDHIGILGGGQLGKMICQAGSKLNLQISCLDPNTKAPSATVCSNLVEGDFNNKADVLAFGVDKDIITIEIENVNTDALKELENSGKTVYPQSSVVELIKDKGLQKTFYQKHNIASSSFTLFSNKSEIVEALNSNSITIPFVQKLRTGGYDGRGVQLIKSKNDLNLLFDAPSVIEDLVNIQKELSVIVARNANNDQASFPVVEMTFSDANLVEFLFCPANISKQQEQEATTIAEAVAEKLGIVGLLAVELFLDREGNMLVNEVAPRTHNSGHHSIEACYTSQFEQQLRAITNSALGSTKLRQPAVMINLLGEPNFTGNAIYQGLEEVLKIEGVNVHIYGKEQTKPNRKMGHVTIISEDLDTAIQKARLVQQKLKVTA